MLIDDVGCRSDLFNRSLRILVRMGWNRCLSIEERRIVRQCTRCLTKKDENQFHQSANNPTRKITHCKECEADKKLLLRYKISMEEYQSLLKSQNHKCKICQRTEVQVGKRLAVDHCHSTGQIRGLLCSKCNQAVGLLNDDPNLGDNLSRYLRSYLHGGQKDPLEVPD